MHQSVDQPVGVVVRGIAIRAKGLGLDYRAGQIGHSDVNCSPPQRRFFGAVLARL